MDICLACDGSTQPGKLTLEFKSVDVYLREGIDSMAEHSFTPRFYTKIYTTHLEIIDRRGIIGSIRPKCTIIPLNKIKDIEILGRKFTIHTPDKNYIFRIPPNFGFQLRHNILNKMGVLSEE